MMRMMVYDVLDCLRFVRGVTDYQKSKRQVGVVFLFRSKYEFEVQFSDRFKAGYERVERDEQWT